MSESSAKLLLVGCGKMGSALLRGILAARLVSDVAVIDPSPRPDDLKNILWCATAADLPASFIPDIVLIAVKPQMVADTMPAYAHFTRAVFLSIAAGLTLDKLATLIGNPDAAIVRTMPNLPASIGQGATIGVANRHVSADQRALCDKLLKAAGTMAWVEDESLIDVVTAVSGSGPAYVFALCEVMAKIGQAMGLPADMAATLARQTIIGSGALLASTDTSAGDLRRAVTSPKGTTEAALRHLLGEQGLEPLLTATMQACAARAKELAGG